MKIARTRTRLTGHPAVPVLRLLSTLSRSGTAALTAVVVCQALLPVGFLVAVGHLLGAVAVLGTDPTATGRAWVALALVVGFWLAEQLAQFAQATLTGRLGHLLTEHTTSIVLGACLRPVGVGHLEDPARADRISLAQGVGGDGFPPSAAVGALARIGAMRLRAVVTAATLAGVLWWAPLPLALGWAVIGTHIGRQFDLQVRAFQRRAGALRRANYLRTLGMDIAAAKEVRVFGLGGWLTDRFSESWYTGMGELFRRRPGASVAMAGRVALLLAGHGVVLSVLVADALRGTISITELTIAVQAVLAMAAFGWVGDPQWMLAGAAAALPHAMALREPAGAPAPANHAASAMPRHGIRFEKVVFGYPGASERPADGLDLWIPAGRSLAVVGDNGAGKTTLIKLLARLYEPEAGRITVDGADLRELDPRSWRQRLAVVFQDFVRFELSARDNVAFGRPDTPPDHHALTAAAEDAGVADLIDELPDGWDTVLSRQFGTVELSGGQWQKIALARALYAVRHGATVLVLDEPTAHLDAVAEARLYERFLALTRGLTTVLISHRFNTVRLADRIAVLAKGRVAEYGSHDELLDLGGRYAAMFRLQADRLGVS